MKWRTVWKAVLCLFMAQVLIGVRPVRAAPYQASTSPIPQTPLMIEVVGSNSCSYDGAYLDVWAAPGAIVTLTFQITNTSDGDVSFSFCALNNGEEEQEGFANMAQCPAESWMLAPNTSQTVTATVTIPQQLPLLGYFSFYPAAANIPSEEDTLEVPSAEAEPPADDSAGQAPTESAPEESTPPQQEEEPEEVPPSSTPQSIAPEEEADFPAADDEELAGQMTPQEETEFINMAQRALVEGPVSLEHFIPFGVKAAGVHGLRHFAAAAPRRGPATQNSDMVIELQPSLVRVRVNSLITPALLSLTLTSVPSFSFGTGHAITAAGGTYNATAISGSVVVSDSRLLASAWKLTAKLGSFVNGTRPNVLSGAVLTLPAPVMSLSGVAIITYPNAYGASMTAGEANPHTIVSAGSLVSLGNWNATYTTSGITLKVAPGTAYAGTNTATITWTLTDGP